MESLFHGGAPKRTSFLLALFLSIFLSASVRAQTVQERVVELDLTRGPVAAANPAIDVKVRYILIEVDNPVGTLVLFTGGSGKLRLALNGTIGRISANTANFLVRSRWRFASSGLFNVVVIDAATDFESLPLGLRGNRTTSEHLGDIADVITDLPNHIGGGSTGPVCLVGTSRGTISAAAYAADQSNGAGPAIQCLVLTSSLTQPSGPPNQNLFDDVPLESVTVPSLVVAHKKDECFVTPPGDAKELGKRLKDGGSVVHVKRFGGDGGTTDLSTTCGALSAHGFFGIEQKVINFIGRWIKKKL